MLIMFEPAYVYLPHNDNPPPDIKKADGGGVSPGIFTATFAGYTFVSSPLAAAPPHSPEIASPP